MKKNLQRIATMFFMILTVSCSQPEKASENQDVTPKDEVAAAANSENAGQQIGKEKGEEALSRGFEEGSQVQGKFIIETYTKKLQAKLALSDEQHTGLDSIITKLFLASGNDLEKQFTQDEAKEIVRNLKTNSHDQVLEILTPEQKERYEKHMKK